MHTTDLHSYSIEFRYYEDLNVYIWTLSGSSFYVLNIEKCLPLI